MYTFVCLLFWVSLVTFAITKQTKANGIGSKNIDQHICIYIRKNPAIYTKEQLSDDKN